MKAIACFVSAALLAGIFSTPVSTQAIDNAAAWHALADRLEPGTAVDIRLNDGHRLKATFIAAPGDALVIQGRTRTRVPVGGVQYESIASLARRNGSGMSAAKVTGIALGSAGAA